MFTPEQIIQNLAEHGSRCAAARLWGWKYRAALNPPTAAVGGFPYPARTCDQWCSRSVPPRNKPYTEKMAIRTAIEGSAKLKDAILRLAA